MSECKKCEGDGECHVCLEGKIGFATCAACEGSCVCPDCNGEGKVMDAGEKLVELGRTENHFMVCHVACDNWQAVYGADGTLFPANDHERKTFKTFEEAVNYLWDKARAVKV